MKVLIVAHESNFTGGANRSLMMVIENLISNYNVEVEVLLPNKNGAFNKKLDDLGIKWYYFGPYFGVMSSIRNDGKDFLRYLKVYIGYFNEHFLGKIISRKLRKKEYDLVYTNTRLPIVGAKIAKNLAIPHVCHVREFGAEKPLWGFWRYKDIYKMSSKIICISDALANKFKEYVPSDKIVTIHNGIGDQIGLPLKKFDTKKSTLDLILTGRIVPDKGQDEAIKAMNKLVKDGYNNVILHIVGSAPKRTHIGWYEDDLKRLVSNYNLEKNVIFEGEITDMLEMRKKMDIELMCAIRETFGRVTVEGMRNGLAVIGTNTGGTLEIIKNGKTGILYKQGNSEDLADKIELLYDDRNLLEEIAKNGYKFSQVNFTPEKNVSAIYSVFKEVVQYKKFKN